MSSGGVDASSYQLPGWQQQGTTTLGDVNSMYGQLSGLAGQYAPVTSALGANPYASGAQAGAGQAGAAGVQQGQSLIDQSNGLYSQINGAMPYGQQLLNTAFDPQNALYAQEFQKNTEQERAGESARGIAMSPYGAGLENQSDQNFNLGWGNNQLQRQATGLGAWTNFIGGQTGAATQAGQLGQQGVSSIQQGSALPYNTYSDIQQGKLGALNAQASALGLPQTAIADMLGYLNAGNSANANALTAQQMNNNQMGGWLSLLGGGIGMIPGI